MNGLSPEADARARYLRAAALAEAGDVPEAIAQYEATLALAPGFAAARSNLGILYARAGRRADALRSYAAAIEAQPDFAAAYCNLAALLVAMERADDAVAVLESGARTAPGSPDIHLNLSRAYRRLGRHRDACAAAARGLALRPDVDGYLRLSLDAFEAGWLELALDANLRALDLDPACGLAHGNCATIYLTTGRYAEAIAAARAAIERLPEHAGAHVNLGLALLLRGEFGAGWDEYAWTWRLPERRPSYPHFDRHPAWNGERFEGRRLLVTREQGFGDAIFAARFLPAAKALGGRLILETAPELASLFLRVAGVDELRIAPEPGMRWDDVDLHVPLLGLARALWAGPARRGARVPYLAAPAERIERWRGRLAAPGLRVGIVWAGSPGHVDDRRRSVSLEHYVRLAAIDGIAWFGLQRGADADRRACGSLDLDPLGAEIEDFADTAAIVSQLDLVIAVDTAVAHLAGALGRPVWTLLPHVPDWRWLLDRADTPWYPTMRLFRQPRPGDWDAVFAALERELALQVAAGPVRRPRLNTA